MAADIAPIVIKKKVKKGGGGHHGGAWKVAYADFVTAMMAFFLLMWLLNATTEEQRKGIADYFDPRIPISRISAGGNGIFNGDSSFSQQKMVRSGIGGSGRDSAAGSEKDQRRDVSESERSFRQGATEASSEASLEAMQKEIERQVQAVDSDLGEHLKFNMTEEGLQIDVIDRSGKPMFASGTNKPSEKMVRVSRILSSVLQEITNPVVVSGHTDNRPFSGKDEYSNWELSADRAATARRLLTEFGLEEKRIKKVEAYGDSKPLLAESPDDPQNRRIGILISKL